MNPDSGLLQTCRDYLKAQGLEGFRLMDAGGGFVVIDPRGWDFTIDFDANKNDYARKNQMGGHDLLIKAITGDKKIKTVLDLSAGLGIDAVFLSQFGFHVTGLERNPVLFLLLSQALARSTRADLRSLRFLPADSLAFLKDLTEPLYQVAYFDPMYPEKRKSALPRKEMQVFRELVGGDTDSREVLAQALLKDFQRVVVKRPLKAEELLPGVVHSFKGKTVRYDLYIPKLYHTG